jgi:hypothetical protein
MNALERSKRQKKAPPLVEVYECDDWVRVYVNGQIVVDGHSLSEYNLVNDILPALQIEVKSKYFEASDLGEFGDDFETAVENARK